MKKLPLLALSALLLVACGNNEEQKKKEDKPKTEQKHKDKKDDQKKKHETKKDSSKKEDKQQSKTEDRSNNAQQQNNEQATNNEQSNNQANNNTQQVQQPQQQQAQAGNAEACVLNGQCNGVSEMDAINAYKSLVSRGVLPQSDGTGNLGQAVKESRQMQQGMSHDEIVRQRHQSWVDAGLETQEEFNQQFNK